MNYRARDTAAVAQDILEGGSAQRFVDLALDGERLLIPAGIDAPNEQGEQTNGSIVVVQNWLEELKERVPVR